MNKKVVSKFGGSSVRDAVAIKRCAQIILTIDSLSIVVVSATYNTTNQLEELAKLFHADIEESKKMVTEIIKRHSQIALDLEVFQEVKERIIILEKEILALGKEISSQSYLSNKMMDELYSFGERLSSLICSEYFQKVLSSRNVRLLDARDVLITNREFKKARPLINEISQKAQELGIVDSNDLFVTQGFIGKSLEGETTTLGREGSDFSAAIFAEAVEATDVYIWTDVPGVATCDPRLVSNAKFLDEMSYEQASLMAKFGAKVLFPRTLSPAMRKGINVFVKDSYNPLLNGTKISKAEIDKRSLTGLTISEVEIEGENLFRITFVGRNLLVPSFDPVKFLEKVDIKAIVHRQEEKVFSLIVHPGYESLALQRCHDYLLEYTATV